MSDLSDNLLLGVNELTILKVIPQNFPHDVVRQVHGLEKLKSKLISECPTTLNGELSPQSMKKPTG